MEKSASREFQPSRNTQCTRFLLTKKQQSQIEEIEIRDFKSTVPCSENSRKNGENCNNYARHIRNAKSASKIRYLPTMKEKSPYLVQSSNKNAKKENKTARKTQPEHLLPTESEINSLQQCYRRICNDDLSSLKLLFKNRDQFGNPKIPLVIRYRNPNRGHIRQYIENNSKQFPKKSSPRVPNSFLKHSAKRRYISTTLDGPVIGKANINLLIKQQPLNKSRVRQSNKFAVEKETSKGASFGGDSLRKQIATGDSSKRPSSAGDSLKTRNRMSREEFISINEQILHDDDHTTVPASKDTIIRSNSSTPLTDHVTSEDNNENEGRIKQNVDTSKDLPLGDINIIKTGMFPNCSIDLEVLDENGDKAAILWHKPEDTDQSDNKQDSNILHDSQSLAAQRKQELKQLLEECTDIARKVNEIELQKE